MSRAGSLAVHFSTHHMWTPAAKLSSAQGPAVLSLLLATTVGCGSSRKADSEDVDASVLEAPENSDSAASASSAESPEAALEPSVRPQPTLVGPNEQPDAIGGAPVDGPEPEVGDPTTNGGAGPDAPPSQTSDGGAGAPHTSPVEPDAGLRGEAGQAAEPPTADAGESALADSGGPDPEPAFGVEGIIAVGYGGLRVVSRDLGETWEDETHWSQDGGDDFDLLRTIAYGNGLWVSGGWRFVTSEDGVVWDDRGDAEDVIDAVRCPVTDGLAFGNGEFLVACGSQLAASTDGLSWERRGPTPDVGNHPYLFFDPDSQQFACSGDDGDSFVSVDGADWTRIDLDTVHLCEGGLTPRDDCRSFYYDGVFLSAEWGGYIRRSTTGSGFQTRYSDDFGNNVFTEYAFAVGRVAP